MPQNFLDIVPYDNCKIFHYDKTLMCFCSKKKANWYIKKQLANKIYDNDIILNFIPKGYGDPVELLEARKNCSVISGKTDNLSRHHVIPTQYRQHFDAIYKDKNSCDLVVLCRTEHDKYEDIANEFKSQLYADYIDTEHKDINAAWYEAKAIFNCINNYYDKLPHDRQVYMLCRLDGLIKEWKFTDAELKSKFLAGNNDYNKVIVDKVGMINLTILWKLHFLKYGKPNFLPTWWKPNLIKVINKGAEEQKTELIEIDIDKDPNLVAMIKKYNLL